MFLKKLTFILIFFLTLFFISSEEADKKKHSLNKPIDINFRMINEISSRPFFYEFQNDIQMNSIYGSVFLGAKINQFSVGVQTLVDYFGFLANHPGFFFRGSWIDFKFSVDLFYRINQYIELQWGLGGIYKQTAIEFNTLGLLNIPYGGLTHLFHINFSFPFPYLDLEIINRLDLIFDNEQNNVQLIPFYLGTVRLNFHPYLRWMGLFVEITGMPWIYRNSYFTNFNTGLFVFGLGAKFDVQFPDDSRYMKKLIAKARDKKEIIPDYKKAIDELRKGNKGKKVVFTEILFNKSTNKLTFQSQKILTEIGNVLKNEPGMKIIIYGYSEYLGNPVEEYDLFTKRANMIKKFFLQMGIDEDRLKVSATGTVYSSGSQSNVPKIIFEKIE